MTQKDNIKPRLAGGFLLLIFPVFTQIPGEPNIAWMPTEYSLIEGSVEITIIWDMWWGENCDHWRLLENTNNVYETEIPSDTPNTQHDETTVTVISAGEYQYIVELCNEDGDTELCSASAPVNVTVTGDDGGGEDVDWGVGVEDWGENYFAPFVDATLWPPFSLAETSDLIGQNLYVLGFVVDRTGSSCEASWGGFFDLDGWTFAQDFMFPLIEDNEMGQIRQRGGDVMVSIGGAANVPLAVACEDVDSLKNQIRRVIEAYELTHLDFDIEGIWVLDTESIDRRSQAIASLQSEFLDEDRFVEFWFTLPVLPNGLTVEGLNVVNSTLNYGVDLSGINIMAMDYGDGAAPDPENNMGEYAIQAAQNLHHQLDSLYTLHGFDLSDDDIWQKIGVTPMIGLNDVTTEIFNLEDAEQLSDFADEHNLKMLSMWSVNRDQECPEGETDVVSTNCSSILQESFEFSTILGEYSENPGIEFNRNIIGYFVSWGVYARNYHVMDIPAEKINIINYAFANIDPSAGTIILGDPYADIDLYYPGDCWDAGCLRGNFHQLQILKDQYPHIRTLISVGGWTWSAYFSDIAMTDESRTNFAQSCVDFVVEYEFDGVDIDWEYPVEGGLSGNHNSPEDKENFTLLLQKLRELLDVQEGLNGNEYLLTVATSANPNYVENIEVGLIHEYLDWINLMTYDFHGPWGGDLDAVTNLNSPLYSVAEDPSPEPAHSSFNLDAAVQVYLEFGTPSEKLNPGLAFYGRSFAGVPDENNGLFSSYTGVPPIGTWENGVFDYWDLEENYIDLGGYTSYWHPEALVPWLYNPVTQIMISYDDEDSINEKANYIVNENIGGAMFWEFSGDKYDTLLDQVVEVFNSYIPELPNGDLNDDGNVDILDVIIMVNYILSDTYISSADMNQDGSVDILDIVLLVNIILSI